MVFDKGSAEQYTFGMTALIALAILALIVFFTRFNYLNIKTLIDESVTDRHAMALGNALLMSGDLVYDDGRTMHRGVLERDLIEANIHDTSFIQTQLGYDRSITVVGVESADGDRWSAMWLDLSGEFQSVNVMNLLDCIDDNVDKESIFRHTGTNFWPPSFISSCFSPAIEYETSVIWRLPIAIRDDDGSVTTGQLLVTIFEITNTEAEVRELIDSGVVIEEYE
jgi:hypothetical protein